MSKTAKYTVNDLLALFEDTLSPADVIASKLMAQVSTAITKERIKLGMTQAEFAKHIGVMQSQISRWEHGNYNFSLEKIADIAAKLDLDVNFTAVNISVYKSLDSFNSECITSPQPFSFVFNSPIVSDSNRVHDAGDLVQIKSNITEDSNYVTLC